MKSFKIYLDSNDTYEAVKNGWSWLAFFFTWIWAYSKGLYLMSTVYLGASSLPVFLIFNGTLEINDLRGFFITIIGFVAGATGNKLYERKLEREGFRLVGKQDAHNRIDAIEKYYMENTIED